MMRFFRTLGFTAFLLCSWHLAFAENGSTTVSIDVEEELLVDMSEPERCISARAIKKIEILNDRVVLFHTTGKKIYQNTLRRKCMGLRPSSIISYTRRSSRLCRLDQFTVVQDVGSSLIPGATCSFDYFQQVPRLDELVESDE